MTVADVAVAVRSFRFRFQSEDDLQAAIADGLTLRGFTVEREVRLGEHGRIDLLVDGAVGLEVKVAGTLAAVLRQVGRYLQSDRIEGLILVTAIASHSVASTVDGKPFVVVTLAGAGL